MFPKGTKRIRTFRRHSAMVALETSLICYWDLFGTDDILLGATKDVYSDISGTLIRKSEFFLVDRKY